MNIGGTVTRNIVYIENIGKYRVFPFHNNIFSISLVDKCFHVSSLPTIFILALFVFYQGPLRTPFNIGTIPGMQRPPIPSLRPRMPLLVPNPIRVPGMKYCVTVYFAVDTRPV